MHLRRILLAAGVCLVSAPAQITNPQPAPPAGALQSLTLIFGSKDFEPSKWDGSAELSAGRIEKITGYHFTESAKILPGNAWQCSTIDWAKFSGGMHPNEKPQPRATSVVPVGVTVYFRAPAGARLHIKLPKGDFTIRPMDVPETGGIFPLVATVEVYRTPPVEQITDAEFEDDYPSIASDGDSVYVAWQGYKKDSEQVFLRRWSNGVWDPRITVTERPGDLFMTALASGGGKTHVVWSEHVGTNWQLQARTLAGGSLGSVETITSGEGSNLFHRAAADRSGDLTVVYQSWRGGHSNIYLRTQSGGRWTPEVELSDPQRDPRANDWTPAVAVDRNDTVWAAWDSYTDGNYNVYLRSVRGGRPGPILKVTNSSRFHVHPSLAVDEQNRVWIAWDEAPDNWGKNVGFLFSGGSGLYESREVRIAVYGGGRWLTPLRQPGEAVPWSYKRYFQTPRLVADAAGRIWLFARPRTSARLPTSLWAAGGKWEVQATYYTGDRWVDPILIPDSVGRNEGELAATADSKGNVFLALVTDHRLWGGPAFGESPVNNDIMFATLRTSAPAKPDLAGRPPEQPGGLPVEPREKEQIARMRSYTIAVGGKTYHIYRGDWHRHTDISADGAGDGSLWDVYRYALDAAGLDWLALTDHQSGDQEYTWWRIQKSADMFHVPGFFTAMYGVERSLPYPNGHRNLMFSKRGVPLLPIEANERRAEVNTGPILYPFLKKYHGVAASHTSHTGMGTDWRDNDPDLEPLVEIYQGARTNSEHEGAPLAPTAERTELHAGGYKPLGFVWNAWAKGYKLGVEASSDHVSTHLSYSCILAESWDRDSILNAIRARHSYAATSNIVMDFRLTLDGKTHMQGDIVAGSSAPELTARIEGTGPLKKVVIVRDNQYIYSHEPGAETYDLRFRENTQLTPGEHYYYVRAEQQDGNLAWSSPIWVKR